MTATRLGMIRADAETVVVAAAGGAALAEARGIEAALLAQVRLGCRLAVVDLRDVTSIGAGLLPDRIGAVGGTLIVHASPGRGTLVSGRLRWPER